MIARRLLAVLLAGATLGVIGCDEQETTRPSDALSAITFLPNDSNFVGYPDGGFSANLLFFTDEGAPLPEIDEVVLLPEAPWISVEHFSVTSNSPGDGRSRWALGLDLRAERSGTHRYREASFTAGGHSVTAPLGEMAIEIREGPSSDVFVLFASGGVHPETVPYEFTVENTAGEPVVLKDVVVSHPRIRFSREQIFADGQPLPAGGLSLAPGGETYIRVDWDVEWPDRPVNLETRGLLLVERAGEGEWAGLHNAVFRRDPALDDS